MKMVSTKKGFLVIVNAVYGCYVDKEYNFVRSVHDTIETEIVWAKEKFENYEEIDFPEQKTQYLLNQLRYMQEYKNSLQAV